MTIASSKTSTAVWRRWVYEHHPKVKIVDIGNWNMDQSASDTVAHGLTYTDIRSVSVMIRNDADDTYHDLSEGGHYEVVDVNILLFRDAAGVFDDPAFDTGFSYNRGWIVITYV